jgi:hypothetical protein
MEIAVFYTWNHSIITYFCGMLWKAMVYSELRLPKRHIACTFRTVMANHLISCHYQIDISAKRSTHATIWRYPASLLCFDKPRNPGIATLAEPGVLPFYSAGNSVQGSARLCVQQYVAFMNLLVTFPEKSLLWRPFTCSSFYNSHSRD